ncbi:AlpA family transcriptional regulator [Arthrobacter sp. ISL-5]|uniref:helix-turn-helix transcriptional regulator n=1 Tax=Arthrobacter sp. ISL-5 TaxID=2819111 RepID=UPI001BECCE98|nr:DNA-binding protein [Arthrobacter sp. ISL-5]MBT2555839.1 DNA-binding protein [Arthrobacter sp. ISL-5]
MDEPLANAAEVADWLGYTPEGLAQMRYRGNGPKFIKLGGKAVRYRWADVQAWLHQQTMQRTGDPSGDAA